MTVKVYQTALMIVLLNFNFLKLVATEKSEDSHPHYEYIQIFKSIPALFEYLFDALEERPEILEKNDVTVFNRNVRDINMDDCESSDNECKNKKREAKCHNLDPKDRIKNDDNIVKREAIDSKDISSTTIAYEYGNSFVNMKGLDSMESNKDISKRMATENVKTSTGTKINNKHDKIKSVKKRNLESNDKTEENNEMFQDYGNAFLGFEYLFGLDLNPEEIEERILMAEKLLEEHNNKKDKDNS